MLERTTRLALLTAYELSLLVAILLLPVMAGARRAGLPAPTAPGGVVKRIGAAYESRR